ncbi:MAG TPA: hypothetical protein VE154_07060 [Chthoniobacterales bacterium]|nr:hypothetical protein [Chthoniobacterales bacterium]
MEQLTGNNSEPLTQTEARMEKIKRIAYHLWLARRESGVSGNADEDYFQAERIFEAHKMRRQLSVGSFCVWAVTFLAARSPEIYRVNAARAAVVLDGLVEEFELI